MSLHDLVKSFGSADEIKEKIVTGSNVDEVDKLKRTPLHMAAWSGNLEALQILIRAGASLDAKAMDGFTALHFASQSSAEATPACIRFLVRKNKGLLNMRITKGNKSALHLAAAKGNIPVVSTLLDLGADASAKTTTGQTPTDLAKSPEVKALITGYSASKNSSGAEHDDDDSVKNDEQDEEREDANEETEVAIENGATETVSAPAESSSVSGKKRPISDVATD